MTESTPRSIILESAGLIRDELSSYEYRLIKSQLALKTVHDDLVFEIRFQSNRKKNKLGGHAAVWVHGIVSSKHLRRWRSESTKIMDGPTHGCVGGIDIGCLKTPIELSEYDFWDVDQRSLIARNVTEDIRQYLFPYFSAFDQLGSSWPWLIQHHGAPVALLELMLAQGLRTDAQKAASNLLGQWGAGRAKYLEFRAKMSPSDLPIRYGDLIKQLAALAMVHSFEI